MELLKNFIREEDGQDLVEYALLLVLLALAAILAITYLGTQVNLVFSKAGSQLAGGAAS